MKRERAKPRRPRKRTPPRAASTATLLKRLRRVEERYELAMGAINEGVYDWNVADDTIYYSDSVRKVSGLPPERLRTPADWRSRIHPEDLPRYDAAFVDLFKGRTTRYECDYRFRAVDGGWRWARQHGIALRDRKGRAHRVIGATGDITELKERELELAATARILHVISSSVADAAPVFEAIVQAGIRLFEGAAVAVSRPEAGEVRLMAIAERDPEQADKWRQRFPFPCSRDYMHGAALLDCVMVDVPDIEALSGRFEAGKRNFAASGYRAMTVVPMVKEGAAIGTISVIRRQPGPLGAKQIALLRTFADQAVIAIENARLFNETREALEQQTATAEILRVTSGSPTDVQPVFEAIVANAARLCDASFASVFLYDGELLHSVAQRNASVEFARFLKRGGARPSRETTTRRCALELRTIHTADLLNDPEFSPPEAQRREKVRTALSVPMIREGVLVGVITLWRAEVRPFSDKQIALVQTFADQAVIAIENVRLFSEIQDSLEQQKASGEVLAAISSSIADTAPVFDKILERCQRLFAGRIVGLNLMHDDGMLHIGAYHGVHREEFDRIFPIPLTSASGSGLAIIEQRVVHYPDSQDASVPARTRQGCSAIGIKSVIFAPLVWEGRGLGAIFVGRDHVSSFSEKEIALLKTFADQAVIAIENVRLFNEIQEKSRQLEAASRHKSQFLANMSHELRTPLNAIIGFARIVMRHSQQALEPKQYENLEKILSSGQHLLALINSVLDLSKIEAGHVEVHAAEVGLAPVLEQCARTIEPLVRGDAVALQREFNGELPPMYVDEEKLRQVVLNLLSNAAKFTAQGSIRLRAHVEGGSVAIAVVDTGIGIAPDKLELIFEEFEQADAGSNRVYGGTGLGLAIARRLARLMGGDIDVQSMPGRGSTFTLRLPLRYAA